MVTGPWRRIASGRPAAAEINSDPRCARYRRRAATRPVGSAAGTPQLYAISILSRASNPSGAELRRLLKKQKLRRLQVQLVASVG